MNGLTIQPTCFMIVCMEGVMDKQRIQVEIPKTEYKNLKHFAVENDTTVSEVVRKAVEEYMVRQGSSVKLDVPQWGGIRKDSGS